MININGYSCMDKDCPKRWCWSPGTYHHRGSTMIGSRNTGASSKTCLHNANHGCPNPLPKPGDPHPRGLKDNGESQDAEKDQS